MYGGQIKDFEIQKNTGLILFRKYLVKIRGYLIKNRLTKLKIPKNIFLKKIICYYKYLMNLKNQNLSM